jgi:hypothetical protein
MLGVTTMLYAQAKTVSAECEGPTSAIRIIGQQLAKEPPSYTFLVTNLTSASISSVIIGEGREQHLQASHWNTPTKMEAPLGWKAIWLKGEDSAYTYYLWQVQDKEHVIQPGKSACGFRIDLPQDNRKVPTYFSDGVKSVQEDFKDIPFKVDVSGGRCYWGVIKVDFLGK